MVPDLQKPGDWQGTAMIPANGSLAFFAYMNLAGDGYEAWSEPVLAWVMAQYRGAGDAHGTVFHGMSLLQVGGTQVNRLPEVCEARHDERGCLIGYVRGTLTEKDMPAWNAAAHEHLKQCRRRKEALGGT